jgi:hypothetical protein
MILDNMRDLYVRLDDIAASPFENQIHPGLHCKIVNQIHPMMSERERRSSFAVRASFKLRDREIAASIPVTANVMIERRAELALVSATVDKLRAISNVHDDFRSAQFHDINISGVLDEKVIDADRLLLTEAACTSDSLGHGSIISVLRMRAFCMIGCHEDDVVCYSKVALIQLVKCKEREI